MFLPGSQWETELRDCSPWWEEVRGQCLWGMEWVDNLSKRSASCDTDVEQGNGNAYACPSLTMMANKCLLYPITGSMEAPNGGRQNMTSTKSLQSAIGLWTPPIVFAWPRRSCTMKCSGSVWSGLIGFQHTDERNLGSPENLLVFFF